MNKTIGRPICFFTELEYGNFNDVPDYDSDTLGEENAEINYVYKELKSGKVERGKAFYNIPYFPANIMVAKDAVNLNENGEGEYEINREISYDQCMQAINDIASRDIPTDEISAEMVRKELQGKQKTV